MDEPHDDLPDDSPEARFGAELRRLRVKAELSLRQLADRLHRAHSTISEFESGRRLPGAEVVEQYEDYFGLARGTLVAQRERARAERLELPRDATVAQHVDDVACPYKGLLAFEDDDAAVFFGRETQVQQVLTRLAEVRFVAVVGASGSGKSSFARAGLLAGIKAAATSGGMSARVALLTPGEHPLDELAGALSAAIGDRPPAFGDGLRADPDAVKRLTGLAGDDGLVIVVDQFEELFTLCVDEGERRLFVDALIAAWRDPTSAVVVIVALRADFYGRVAAFPELAAAVVAHQTLIGPMSAVDLRRAIELPAAKSGLLLQPGLVETILDDLAGEPGSLPLLSHALLETCKRRQRLTLTVAGYHEAGGVRGAIAQTAERTLLNLPEADRPIARAIFLSLTDVGEGAEPTRRRVDRAELATHPHSADWSERVLAVLTDARLVSVEERTVVVAHEALIRHWPRLRGWIDADRAGLLTHRRLTDAAREWDTLKREPAALYRGARLATASEWATDNANQLSQLERDFLSASGATQHNELVDKARKNEQLAALLEAARHRTHRLRVLASALAVLIAVAAALAVWAIGQRNDAHRQATEATSLALAASTNSVFSSRPDISLLLAFEAYRASPQAETQSSVLHALITIRAPRVVAVLHGGTRRFHTVTFSPDGRTLASVNGAGTIQLWETSTHKQIGTLPASHTSPVGRMAFSPDGRILAAAGRAIGLWDARTRKQIGVPLTGPSDVTSMAFSPDGRVLAYASVDGTIRFSDLRTHKQLGRPLTGHTSPVDNMSFSPNGRTLAVADANRTIRLWDVRTHTQVDTLLAGHTGFLSSMAFGSNGRTLASADRDGKIRFWDLRTRKPLGRPLTSHTRRVDRMVFSRDGRILASAGRDGMIRLWDARTRKQIGIPLIGPDDVSSMAFSPDGRILASASADDTIRLWDARRHTPLDKRRTNHRHSVRDLAFGPDARILASAGRDGMIRLWDARTRKQIGIPLTGTGDVTNIAFSPDGHTLASAGRDGTIRLWDARTRKQTGIPLASHTRRVDRMVFSPDGHTLASAGRDGMIRLWDARTRKQIGKPLAGSSDVTNSPVAPAVTDMAFRPDGRILVSASNHGTIRLWDTRTQKQIGKPLTGHKGAISSVVFSPDGRTMASAAGDDTILLWDGRKHTTLAASVTEHLGIEQFMAFSPNGRILASADERAIRLWDVRTHTLLGKPLTGPTARVAFSPDGRTLASADFDGALRSWTNILWRTDAELHNEVCRLVGSGLSRSEWERYAAPISYHQSCP